MKKIETFARILKALMINLIICSLLQNPFISNAMAATTKANSGFEPKDILTLANGALNVYGSYLGQKQQILQQQIAAANNQRLMAQLSPSCRKTDGTACYTSQAKFFPECALPASMSNMPVNACSSATPEVSQISSMITYESIAQGWMNYYDQMSNEASNSSYAVGLRCLEDKQKAVDSQITEMMNSLQRLQDRLNQDKQVFRDNNKKLLEDMNTANDELFGASKNNLKIKTQDFAKYFSQSCQSVIGKENLKNGTSTGLNGILQGLSSTNKAAADYNLNRTSIEDDVRRETQKVTTAITSGGIDDWLSNGKTQSNIKSSKFPSMEIVIKKQADELMTARQRINKELAKVGYTPPAMDQNFSVDMNTFMAGANDFFKKKFVNDCVTGAEKGIAIPVDDILRALEQKSTHSEGTARNDYRVALKKILDSDAMIADKMNQIKALETDYPGMTVTYKDSTQNRVTETPYDLFMKTIDKCEQRYVQDDQFTSKGSNGVSYQQNVTRAKAALQELKNLNDGFSSKIASAITDQVFNCNGESFKSGSDCGEETLKTTSNNFCINHASQCANDIQGCYAEANNHVQARKTKMENLAKKFNANVANMIARSNALYEQQKAAVTNITKLIQSKFPGTNFEIPKDMFVSMPELKKDTYGVEMAGDGDIKSFLEGENSMPAKIDKLKQMFKTQRDAVKTATTEYIGLQKDAMKREHDRWADLNSQCKNMVDSSSKALAQMNSEGQKRQAEEDGQTGDFCSRYSSLADNPLGACEDAKDLATDMSKISRRLDPSVSGNINAFRQVCNQYNNESDNGSDASNRKNKRAANKAADLKTLCVNSDGTGTRSNDEFISSLKKLSPILKKNLGDDSVMSYILGTSSTAPTLSDDDASDMVAKLRSDYSAGKNIDNTKLLPSFKNEDALKKLNLNDSNICSSLIKSHIVSIGKDSFENLNDAASKSSDFTSKNDDSITLLKDLIASNSGSVEDKASDLGEKLSGAPCDMQNKSSLAKGTGGFDLGGFDSKILGSSK